MNQRIESRSTITIPPTLVPVIDRLVTEYALEHKEEPGSCRAAVEEMVVRLGLEAYRAELVANGQLAERMGWAKSDEEEQK